MFASLTKRPHFKRMLSQQFSTKTKQLFNMLRSKDTEFIMEAHSGLSAKIVEETGFKGIWGSGLSISASLGVRDCNEASWSQVLDVVEFMTSTTSIPLMLDADTGYGNFNNARYIAKKLVQIGVSGMCIEDKQFPKKNSLLSKDEKLATLADLKEFTGKIRAIKDSVGDNIALIARMETFIELEGKEKPETVVNIALERAHACREAGADAVLIHSKKSTPDDIEAFMKVWNNSLPVVIVPTKYYKTPTENFRKMGVGLVIWANHNLRSSIKAMQETSKKIFQDQHLKNVETNIVPVNEVFRLQNEPELDAAEKKYS
jgi:phosphoenolpyruvate phosphomutase